MKTLHAVLLTAALSLAASHAFAQANFNGNPNVPSGADVGGNNAPPNGPPTVRPRLGADAWTSGAAWTSGSGSSMGENSNANIGGSGSVESPAYSPRAMDAWERNWQREPRRY